MNTNPENIDKLLATHPELAAVIPMDPVFMQLTKAETEYVENYIVNRNKLEAYTAAYSTENSAEKTIRRNAQLVYRRPRVKKAIEICLQQMMEISQINAAWVLRRAALIADFNIRDFIEIDADGRAVLNFEDASDDDWYCIQELVMEECLAPLTSGEKVEVEKVKFKPSSKIEALKLVGQHRDVSAFDRTIKVTGAIAHGIVTPDQFVEAREKMLKSDDI